MMIVSQGDSGRSINEGATKTCDDVRPQMEKSAATAWLSIEQQRVWRAWLLGSAHITSCLSEELRRHGLELCEYEILASLSEADDYAVRMSVLATKVHQSRSRLTHAVERLEARGLVTREPDVRDRRGVVARLSPAGMDLLRQAAPDYARTVRHVFVDPVGPEDFAAMGRAIRAVLSVPN
ncbi:MarR family transcriptional regulator [Cutibacterium acnes]